MISKIIEYDISFDFKAQHDILPSMTKHSSESEGRGKKSAV